MNLNPINPRFWVPLGGAILMAMLAAMPARADYQSTVLAQNPAGYWRLNETSQPPPPPINATNIGTVGSPAGDGTYQSGCIRGVTPGAIVSQPANGCVQLTGIAANRVRIPDQPQWSGAAIFSVEFWIKPTRTSTLQTAAADVEFIATPTQRNGWLLYQGDSTLSTGNGFVFRCYNSTGLASQTGAAVDMTLDPAQWYHVVGTFDGTHILLYTNGFLAASNTIAGTFRPNSNTGIPLTFGARADGVSGYYESVASFDEAAYYTTVLDPGRVLAHYEAGTNASPSTPYQQVVLNDSPMEYLRFNEPPDVNAANSGTLGSAANGLYQVGTTPGVAGPSLPPYPGFEAANKAVSVPGTGPNVDVPALNFNTNTVTITGWVKSSTSSQTAYGGIIVCHAGTTDAGLIIDYNGGLGVGYRWNNVAGTYNWSPSTDGDFSGSYFLPNLPASDWAYVALVVQPNQAAIYLCDSTNAAHWAGITNPLVASHASQAFDGDTLFGWSASPDFPGGFAGNIDEVAMFDRALGQGELYTQYGAAVGGLAPKIFGDLQGPLDPVAAGDSIVLSVDAGGTPPLTYTWHAHGGTVATTTNSTLVIASSTLADGGTYDVTVGNGSGTAQSASVNVSVVTPSQPAIVQLLGYQSRMLYPTGTLNMAVSATGGGLKYQWYKNTAPIASATASAFTIPHVVSGDAGSYSVGVTNIVGTATSGPPAILTIATVTAGSYEAAIIASGPEAWWRLDEAAGSTNMWDGMGRHDGYYVNVNGTVPPVVLGVAGALVGDTNTAASFSANGGVGVVPYSPVFSGSQFSMEGWARTAVLDDTTLTSWSCTYGTGGECWRTTPAGYWSPYGNGAIAPLYDNGQTNAGVVANGWTHLVMCYDPAGNAGYPWIYYIDGFNLVGGTWQGSVPNSGGPLIIGGRGVSATTLADSFFNGQVDEVAIYQRVLTAAEIQAHFTARGFEVVPLSFNPPLLSQTVTTGKSISFSTIAQGTAPISLQWYKDGKPIKDATNSAYAIASTALGDAGTYVLWGTNAASTNATAPASLVVISPVSYANVTNNLVLHLRFDGDTLDTSGHGNDGTPSSTTAPTFVSPGIIGSQALHYETIVVTNTGVSTNIESTSYVTVGAVGPGPPADLRFDTTTSFSVSLWAKLAVGAIPGDVPFIGTATNSTSNPGWDLSPSFQAGGWQWNLGDGVVPNGISASGPDGSLNDGNWHNFVLSVDRTAKVADTYLDGVHAASTSIASLGNIDNNNYWPIVIGQDPTYEYFQAGYGPYAISATVDDIGIWRQALAALDVAQIASAGSNGHNSFDTVAPITTGPTMTAVRGANSITISWTPAGGTLLGSPALSGAGVNWQPIGTANPAVVPITGAAQFFRVQAQ